MASYHAEHGVSEQGGGGGPQADEARRGRWVAQVVDDFMDVGRSGQGTPVAAAAAPESYLAVARLFGEFMGEGGSEHQRFLEGLIMRLNEEANAGTVGPPPASAEFIRTLPVLPAEQCRGLGCAICNEAAPAGPGTRLPCCHHFHRDCIRPWLELHNTCPMCRAEVPSDDPRWLERRREHERREARELRDNAMFG
ncbi:hypothetical protein H4R18_002715 [Coemansia javaensis]|uniref:RING-type domain-containing protein n=1 Tax=Coemansia javaensis TaxID=2761396 RepID=A0A9W8HFX2_9FUNG|nr:hypothetical protein H4R18_002715 [Coemansia javaensis]